MSASSEGPKIGRVKWIKWVDDQVKFGVIEQEDGEGMDIYFDSDVIVNADVAPKITSGSLVQYTMDESQDRSFQVKQMAILG